MADRRPGPNFKPAAPSRPAHPPPHTGLSFTGAGVGGARARYGASVRRNLFQQQQSSQPTQSTRHQPTAAPDSQQSQGHYYYSQSSQQSQNNSQSQTCYNSQTYQNHQQSYHPQPQYQQQQASYLTQAQQPYSYSYSQYPQDHPCLSLPHLQQYQQLPPNYEDDQDTKMATSSSQSQPNPQVTDPDQEIVIRDKETGEINLGNDPPTPPYDEDTEAMMEARMEQEKERERLADAVREWLTEHEADGGGGETEGGQGGGRGGGGAGGGGMDTEELLEAVKASLKAKVAVLSEDKWMFEREEVLHLH